MSPRHPAAGMALGVLAVALFGATLPITRWTLGAGGGPADAPAMSALFITFSRVVLAAGISALCLLALRARWPTRDEWGPLRATRCCTRCRARWRGASRAPLTWP